MATPKRSSTERVAISRLAAHALHARYDSRDLTRAARATFLSRFERDVDPTGELEPSERARRAAHAKASYFGKLGVLSGKARRRAA